MVTIKDVARVAGVSHGTVSNVLRKQRGVSLENIERVENAIRQLGYRPTVAARNLKTNKSSNIAIVLPNISDSIYAQLFQSVERTLSNRGFTTTLYVTSDVPEHERSIIEAIRGSYVAGLIVVTCQPQNVEQFRGVIDQRIHTVFVDREVGESEFNFLSFDNYTHVKQAVSGLIREGCRRIALVAGPLEYSSERRAANGYRQALADGLAEPDYQMVAITNLDKETSFNRAFDLLRDGLCPDAIICTGPLIAEGVLKALSFVRLSAPRPRIVSLWSDSWSDVDGSPIARIRRPYMHLGKLAADTLLDGLDVSIREPVRVVLEDSTSEVELHPTLAAPNARPQLSSRPPLKALLLESPSSYATKCLLDDFQGRSGIRVETETIHYNDLYEKATDPAAAALYDICQIDIPWLPEFAERGLLQPLDGFLDTTAGRGLLEQFLPGIPDQFARHDDHVFGLPYMYCSQILFYRKDLFASLKFQTMFKEQFHTDLRVPRSWAEFNLVSRFFTRAYNPESETPYGTTLGGMSSSGAFCEFVPRLHAFGGVTVGTDGSLSLHPGRATKALENYCESYRYSSPEAPENWWEEQVDEFRLGKAAMMMLFSSHAAGIVDRNTSLVVGNIGYDVIPGNRSLLGGYSLGIYSGSQRKDEAFEFIKWACTQLASVSTILGGSVPTREMHQNTEVLSIFPWYLKAFEIYKQTLGRRSVIRSANGDAPTSGYRSEQIIGAAVHDAIVGVETPRSAIDRIVAETGAYTADD